VNEFLKHPEMLALRKFCIKDANINKFQILCLPENLTSAARRVELVDAGNTIDLVKKLKEAGIPCGASYDLTPEAKTITRRGNDVWLGTVWILSYIALPFFLDVLANMVTSRKQSKVHVNLRIRRDSEVVQIDYSGDGKTLSQVLNGFQSERSSTATQKRLGKSRKRSKRAAKRVR
jgi:hypothetical protein